MKKKNEKIHVLILCSIYLFTGGCSLVKTFLEKAPVNVEATNKRVMVELPVGRFGVGDLRSEEYGDVGAKLGWDKKGVHMWIKPWPGVTAGFTPGYEDSQPFLFTADPREVSIQATQFAKFGVKVVEGKAKDPLFEFGLGNKIEVNSPVVNSTFLLGAKQTTETEKASSSDKINPFKEPVKWFKWWMNTYPIQCGLVLGLLHIIVSIYGTGLLFSKFQRTYVAFMFFVPLLVMLGITTLFVTEQSNRFFTYMYYYYLGFEQTLFLGLTTPLASDTDAVVRVIWAACITSWIPAAIWFLRVWSLEDRDKRLQKTLLGGNFLSGGQAVPAGGATIINQYFLSAEDMQKIMSANGAIPTTETPPKKKKRMILNPLALVRKRKQAKKKKRKS